MRVPVPVEDWKERERDLCSVAACLSCGASAPRCRSHWWLAGAGYSWLVAELEGLTRASRFRASKNFEI